MNGQSTGEGNFPERDNKSGTRRAFARCEALQYYFGRVREPSMVEGVPRISECR
jgi:hypothetical protein